MKYAPYSFSSISLFEQCRRKFKYAKIDKAPKSARDIAPLLKGGAVHSILEHFPESSLHKLAVKFQYIVDKFYETEIGKKYLLATHMSEFNFGLSHSFKSSTFYGKETLFRGKIDYIGVIDEDYVEIIEVENINDVPDEYEIIEIIE